MHTLQRVYRIRIARGRSLLAFPGRDRKSEPRLARSTFTGTGEPGSDDAASTQVAARVTSTVCGEPPSRMKVTVTVVSGG
jgi:hypothetical protein